MNPFSIAVRSLSGGLLVAAASTATVTAGPLTDAWQAALKHDARYLAAVETRASDSEAAAEARALFRPQIQLQAGASWSGGSVDVNVPTQYAGLIKKTFDGASSTAAVQISQALYDPALTAQARQLREKARAAQSTFSAEQQQLILRVADVVFDLMAADDAVVLIQTQKAALAEEKARARVRFDTGAAKITDLRDTEAQWDQVVANEINALAQRDIARAQYQALTGQDPERLVWERRPVEPSAPAVSLVDWQDQAEHAGPNVVGAEHALNSARATVNQYRWSGRPKISAVGAYSGTWLGGGTGQLPFPSGANNYVAGIQASIPLVSGGYYSAELRAALASVRKAERDLDGERRSARVSAEQSWLGVSSGAARIRALRAAVISADLQLRAATTGREVGIRTQSDVLNVLSATYSTRQQLNQAVYDYEKSRLRLAASTGSLNAQVMSNIDSDF